LDNGTAEYPTGDGSILMRDGRILDRWTAEEGFQYSRMLAGGRQKSAEEYWLGKYWTADGQNIG
jgi:hypothetical protein